MGISQNLKVSIAILAAMASAIMHVVEIVGTASEFSLVLTFCSIVTFVLSIDWYRKSESKLCHAIAIILGFYLLASLGFDLFNLINLSLGAFSWVMLTIAFINLTGFYTMPKNKYWRTLSRN